MKIEIENLEINSSDEFDGIITIDGRLYNYQKIKDTGEIVASLASQIYLDLCEDSSSPLDIEAAKEKAIKIINTLLEYIEWESQKE